MSFERQKRTSDLRVEADSSYRLIESLGGSPNPRPNPKH